MHDSTLYSKASEVIGSKVIDADKHYLGKIQELLINKQDGYISYVVINHSFLGIGSDLFAMSWDNLYYDTSENCYIVNVNRQFNQQAVWS